MSMRTTSRLLLLLLLLGSSVQAWGSPDCTRHPVYCSMVQLQPHGDREFLLELSGYVSQYSRKYGTDWRTSVLVGMLESSLRPVDAYHTCRDAEGRRSMCIQDLGVWQLNVDTLLDFRPGVDIQALRVDLREQTRLHILLLRSKVRMCVGRGVWEKYAWSCYHSVTNKLRINYIRRGTPYIYILDYLPTGGLGK